MKNESLFVTYSDKSVEQIFEMLQTSDKGLSAQEVEQRRKKYGPNIINSHGYSIFTLLYRQAKSPLIYIFLAIAIISLAVGEWYNGIIIFLFVFINVFISFYQEYRAEHALALLKKYLISQVRVIRNGHELLIDSTQLVPGDVITLKPGDVLTADIRFIQAVTIVMDESVLTGESAPVSKTEKPIANRNDQHDAITIGFAGTTVISGSGVGVVIATARDTLMGDIAALSASVLRESSFAKDLTYLSNFIVVVIVITLIILFLINIAIRSAHNLFDIFIFSTALAITAIPEALPSVVTFCLARGVAHLAKQKVVVKRLSAIESLGSIDILCTDKTGTLTENILTISAVHGKDQNNVILYAVLAAEISYETMEKQEKGFDSVLWNNLTQEDRRHLKQYKKIIAFPFDPVRRKNSAVVESKDGLMLIMRGSVQDILHCTHDNKSTAQWIEQEEKMGHRILAIATKHITAEQLKNNETLEQAKDCTLAGYVSFEDPLKKTAAGAVQMAQKLGLAIKILSGDTKAVCGAVATRIGLIDDPANVITGQEFEAASEREQRAFVKKYDVFARVLPDQKYKILHYLQEKYEVAYLGDGINDAPALKIADVSIAVPEAVDIAREVSDIILLKRSLYTIVNGIQEGRIIFANTLKYIKATLASNIGNFFSLASATLFLDYLPMLPLHLLLVNLMSDFPYIAISTDHVDQEDIKTSKKRVLPDIIKFTLFFGLASSLFDFIFFIWFKSYGKHILQTGWFMFSVITELVFIFSMRTRHLVYKGSRPSALLFFLSLTIFVLTLVLPYIPVVQNVLQFTPLSAFQLLILFVIVGTFFMSMELLKRVYYAL